LCHFSNPAGYTAILHGSTNTNDERRNVATDVERQWLSYKETQAFTGLGRTKLWELICSGEVEAAKVDRAVRINQRSVDEYMRRNSYVEAKK
jgi:excisionase family DNA binding protein